MKKNAGKPGQKPTQFTPSPFATLKGFQAAPPAPEKPVKEKPTVPAPGADADDATLFLRAMGDVRRLQQPEPSGPRKVQSASPQPQRGTVRELDEAESREFLDALRKLKLDVTFTDSLPDGDEEAPRPLPVNRLRQVRRGAIRIDLELDLHGLTRDEALESLEQFIAGAYRRGQQAVLVITGKGNNSPGEPVLQAAVLSWLRDKGRSMVTEFAPAPRTMGGSGAVVVFLRSKEKDSRQEG
ncbi:MAG: DNA mismatch repair protein MutS [Desulfuromonadales bacterium]|nr:MAG: DNA mismatch repair protein MutS [Desulfuromonadales bacterium]